MNFYIADSLDEINMEDYNVEFSDELVDLIFKYRNILPENAKKLYGIDPYSDVVIEKHDLLELIEICGNVLDIVLLKQDDEQENSKTIKELMDLVRKAIISNKKIISVGD